MEAMQGKTIKRRHPGPGPQGKALAENLKRLRAARKMSTRKLAAMMTAAGRPVQATAITKVEAGDRTVDVDELVAMAAALGVSPSALLMPPTAEGETEVSGFGTVPARAAWAWADGRAPLVDPASPDFEEAYVDFQMHSRPKGLRMFVTPSEGGWMAFMPWSHDDCTPPRRDPDTEDALLSRGWGVCNAPAHAHARA